MVANFTYLYIYIYIYIYCHPQTDSFVISQFFIVARLARCFKLGLIPSWLYISQVSYPRDIVILCVNEGIFLHTSFYIYVIGYLILEKWYFVSTYVEAGKYPHQSARAAGISIYIVIHRETVSLYQNSSGWLLTIKEFVGKESHFHRRKLRSNKFIFNNIFFYDIYLLWFGFFF